MSFFLPQNPGIGGLDELTTSEEAAVQLITGLGSSLQILRTNLAGDGLEWATVAGASLGLDDLTDVTLTGAAQGDILYRNAGGWVNLAAGTNGHFLKTQGAGANPTWAAIAGGGDVSKVGTPVDNQVGVWTGDGTLEGSTTLTFTGDILTVTNNEETASATALIIQGDRATPTNNDEVIAEFKLSDSAGNQDTVATIRGQLTTVTSGAEVSQLKFGVVTAGTLASEVVLTGTAFSPNVNDGNALGTTSLGWGDLHLATGGVINWGNGEVTLTESDANTLTLAGGTLALGTNSLTMTGSLAATGARVTKGWFTDVESTNMPTVGGTAILTSLTAPQFTTVEVGHATDTTLSRVSAGVIAVEGVTVPTISSTNTLTNKRVTKRTGTTTSHATPTINTDNVDFYSITAQTEAITSMTTNLSGTPTEGQTLWIAITGTGARAITWGTSFEASTIALPTTTVSTNRLDVGFVWNTVTSKWRCVATC